MQEHVKLITSEVRGRYLRRLMQNELLSMMASSVKKTILEKINLAKYILLVFGNTSDQSHQEQMLLVVRNIFMNTEELKVTKGD